MPHNVPPFLKNTTLTITCSVKVQKAKTILNKYRQFLTGMFTAYIFELTCLKLILDKV